MIKNMQICCSFQHKPVINIIACNTAIINIANNCLDFEKSNKVVESSALIKKAAEDQYIF